MPKSAGEVSVYAQSVLYSDEELAERYAEYENYLNDTLSLDDNASDPSGYLEASKQFRLNYQKSLLGVYGGNSRLTVSVPNKTLTNNVMYVSKHQEDVNGTAAEQTHEILTSIDFAEIDGTYYVAYVTQQDFFEKSGSKYIDSSNISRFYLRTFTIDDDNAVVWGTPYLLRSVVNFEEDSTKDGVYSGGSLVKGYNDAYLANIKFLDGKIGDKLAGEEETFEPFAVVEEETFLLFEMNGSTYVIAEDSLKSITGPSHTGVISSFFTPEQTYGDAIDENSTAGYSSGKSEVTVGADGDGNVAAVYTSSVPNTTNNAIYIAYWDPENGAWSDGVMLAMNYMDVYERSVANDWDADTTEAAYLDETLGGGMTSFVFSNLQLALGRATSAQPLSTLGDEVSIEADAAESVFGSAFEKLGVKLPENEDDFESLAESFTREEMYAISEQLELLGVDTGVQNSDTPELLILTQGALTELWEYDVDGTPIIAAKNVEGEDTAEHAKLGVYAISYGKGGQQVGNVAIRFGYNEFTVGSKLYSAVSFKNVGDAAIRGCKEQPIVVNLMVYDADGAGQTLASWQITESIGAGQTVQLSTDKEYCKALSTTLGDGDYFYITLSEDEYADTPYTYNSSTDAICKYTFNAADKPELAVESFNASAVGVTESGDARIETSFNVTNRGLETAEDVYVQFSYVSGYDEDGSEIYTPLDITDSDLYVSQQKLITDEMTVLGVNDLANGIIYLGTDSTFYTDDYYITEAEYKAILSRYYSTTAVSGWEKGTYNNTSYWYDKLYYNSAYAAYTAGQEAVSGWSNGGNGYYYNNSYSSYTEAKNAADAARKAEYVLTAAQYNALSDSEKASWIKASDNTSYYILTGYSSYREAYAAYEAALADGTQNIKGNYYRTVDGEIRVSPDKFCGNISGSLNIKVEVFSNTSNADNIVGLHVSDHADEYYSINNFAEKQVEQRSFVSGAAKIVLARGSEHTLPISIRTTTGKAPVISVIEVEDGADELSTLYFVADGDTDGVASTATGAVKVVGKTIGEGVIHVVDSATNTTYPIAYIVAEEGTGINIFNDDAQFTFYNVDGSLYDPDMPNQDWSFKDVSSWTEKPAVPYLGNLAIGKEGAYFTFDTKASEFSFDLIGSATVKSNKFPGEYMVTNDGTAAPPTSVIVDFGNETQITHTVTVKVTDTVSYLDTVHLAYEGEYTPSDDAQSPGLYFSRSFPTAGSVKSGEEVTITVYAVDESGLQSMFFNGETIADRNIVKTDDGLWSYTFTVSENNNFKVTASDRSGNTTVRNIEVDWFGENETTEYGKSPSLDVTLEKVVGNETETVTSSTALADTELAAGGYIYVSVTADDTDIVHYVFNSEDAGFEERGGDVADKLTANGYYMVKAESTDSYNTWSAYIFALDCIEATPEIRVSQKQLTAPNGVQISYTATKDEESTSKLKAVTVNDIDLLSGVTTQSTSYSGSITVNYGGMYTFKAVDTKNVTGITSIDVKVPIDISADAIFAYIDAWGQPTDGMARYGEVTIDFTKITGGDFANTSKVLSFDECYGSYEFVVVSNEDLASNTELSALKDGEESWLTELAWTAADCDEVKTQEGLKVTADGESTYSVIIRDRLNPAEYSTMAVYEFTLSDNAIDIIGTSALLASKEDAYDGKIFLTVDKGATGKYEFAILPMKVDSENSTEENTVYIPLTESDFMSDSVVWRLADFDGEGNTVTFENVGSGKYQIAVRSLYVESDGYAELDTLSVALVDATEKLASEQALLENAISSMLLERSACHDAWRDASEKATEAKNAYDEVLAKLESGDTTVTSNDADDAYDTWQAAVSEETNAKTAYIAMFDGIDSTVLENILELRTVWLSADIENKATAREAYETAVTDFCTAYQQQMFAERLANAENTLTNAESAYNTAAAMATSDSAQSYADNVAYWDGMLLSASVSVSHGTNAQIEITTTKSYVSTPIGTVTVKADGGTAYDGGEHVYYQFALLPIESKSAAVDYTDNMHSIGELDLDWQLADDLSDIAQQIVYNNVDGGWYQIFVRVVYDPDITDGFDVNSAIFNAGSNSDLYSLKVAYENAKAAIDSVAITEDANRIFDLYVEYQNSGDTAVLEEYLAAIGNDSTILAARDAWLNATDDDVETAYNAYLGALYGYLSKNAAKALEDAAHAYSELLDTVKTHIEDAYTANPANYNTAAFAVVEVEEFQSVVIDIAYSAIKDVAESTDKVVYTLYENRTLTDNDAAEIYSDSKSKNVVISVGDKKIFIMEDSLTNSHDVANAVNNFTDGNGNVVEYTSESGTEKIVPICLVEDGNTAYMYIGAGNYAVVQRDSSFDDVYGHWAFDNIIFGANRELFKGVTETEFAPDITMTRAMMVTLVYRLAGEPTVSGEMPFKDVAEDTWYYDAVLFGYQNDVIVGVSDTMFDPDGHITREQMVTLFYRYLSTNGLVGKERSDISVFDDADNVSAYAKDAFAWSNATELVVGTDENLLLPKKDATRAEIAAITERVIRYVLK